MYTLIQHQRLATASTITFSNIPQIYTDLLVVASLRDSSGEDADSRISFNGLTTNFTARLLNGNGAAASIGTTARFIGSISDDVTANIFNSAEIYIPNYSASAPKSFSVNSVSEDNATSAYQNIVAGLWNNTAAITSITISSSGNNFRVGSSATLYGINRTTAIGKPKAIGGNITYANGYWVHTFTGSGTFYTQQNLEIDALVVAGGGAGGSAQRGGGGGAGGLLTVSPRQILAGSYLVVVGAGGASIPDSPGGTPGADGNTSSFLSISPSGGGGGGAGYGPGGPNPLGGVGRNGGSGGGGGINANSGQYAFAGGTGISGQGNNGGSSGHDHSTYGKGGGGGGAGAVGASISANGQTGSGGIGAVWNGTYYAGGGGGAGDGSNPTGPGGLGGGGAAGYSGSSAGTAGTSNTGGGGGAGFFAPSAPSGAGGSGVVVIRYRAD
jgi:hypothetical protein